MSGSPLVVVAIGTEAAHLQHLDVVLTGIGKVSAAVAVTRAIAEHRPSFVLNVGTAGALRDGLEGAHRIGRVLEHDVDHAFLRTLTGEDSVGEIELDPAETTTLASGDAFISDPAVRLALGERADLVDMEGFAVARACQTAGVECRMVKVVSDTASEDAARSWRAEADRTARLIAEVVDQHL
jgi:adenosylhomocysteine nucleosidase